MQRRIRRAKWGLILLFVLIAATICAIMVKPTQDVAVSGGAIRQGSVLIIDPGHGGEDGGAVSADGLRESGVNWDIALRLRSLAVFCGISAVLTREREAPDYPDAASTTAERKRWDTRSRVELVNSIPNGVLVSVHQNNFPGKAPRGPQVFFASTPGSEELARIAHKNMAAGLYPESRRSADKCPRDVYLMSHVKCTAVLAECGFLSNPEEAALLATEEHRLKIAVILLASYWEYTEKNYEDKDDILLHGVRE